MDAVLPISVLTTSLLSIDCIWLWLRYEYHMKIFETIQKSKMKVRYLPAFLLYIVLASALYMWAVKDSKSLKQTMIQAAIVGFCMYAFYDLTNYATLNGWTMEFALIDISWGITLCTLASVIGYYFLKRK